MSKRHGSNPRPGPWRVVVGLVLIAWATGTRADSYLIISLLADHLTIVSAMQAVGSHMDSNKYQTVPLTNTELDDFAVQTAGAVVRKARPADKVEMLRAVDPKLRKMSGTWIDDGSIDVQALVDLIDDLFKPPPDSRLIVIAPLRNELEIKSQQDYSGKGVKAAGLGFYVDGATQMGRTDTGEIGVGFLGVFANFQIVVVNITGRKLERQQRVVVGATFAAARAPDRTPWNALSPKEKMQELGTLMKGEIERLLPGMLPPAKP